MTKPKSAPVPPVCVVYYSPAVSKDAFCPEHEEEGHPRREWRPVQEFFSGASHERQAAILIVDESILDRIRALKRIPPHVVIVTVDRASDLAFSRRAHISASAVREVEAKACVLSAACQLAWSHHAAARRQRRLAFVERELLELNQIGIALMAQHDQQGLLRKIVQVGRRLTSSDGGGLLLANAERTALRLALFDFESIPELADAAGDLLPVDDSSAVGHAAKTRRPVIISDADHLPPDAGFVMDPVFEERFHYYRRSLLIVPMIDQLDHLVGVLVFVNRKSNPDMKIVDKESADRYVLPYTDRDVQLARSLASQAAMLIENSALYERIQRILESFVKASVTAIDQRDPTTAGHSMRVAALTTGLASAVERTDRGPYRDTRFTHAQMRELRYAALLHDFGKVTVHEDVLMKAKKLPPVLWERVDSRFDLIARTLEADHYKNKTTAIDELDESLAELERLRRAVRAANEPSVMPTMPHRDLFRIAGRTFRRPDGEVMPYLTPDELHFLELPHGTLDDHERAEVQSHVEETYRFLASIPWTDDLKNLVDYARGHHEKLDGSGYPRGLVASQIPVQTRVMTIADIFDALTESDRPYKRAVPADQALDIIRAEAKAGRLDEALVDILIESQAYRPLLEQDWRHF